MNIFRLALAFSSVVVLGLGGCGQPPSKPKGSIETGSAGAGTLDPSGQPVDASGNAIPGTNGLPTAASLESFKINLYEPVLKPFCESCHDKTFVDQDVNKAHAAFLGRAAFDKFGGIDQTLPVLKMKQAHNCWNAEVKTCVDTMADKMNLWLGDLKANGFEPTPIKYPNESGKVDMKTALAVTVPIPAEYVGVGVDKATLAAPFVLGTTPDVDGPIKVYATSPAATARLNAVNAAQSITFTMNATVAGTYFVWARVKTLADANNEFFITANAGAAVPFSPPVTGKDTWKWAQVTTGAGAAAVPFSFAVAAPGAQTLRVGFREGGASINYLVITSKADFNGELFSNSFSEISVPLKVAGADDAKIIATVWDKTTADGKKSLGVLNLKIASAVPLHIKTIYPLINGIYSQNQGTYTIVDTVAGGPDPAKAIISTGGSTASTWIVDRAVDNLSFAFETIEVAK